MFDNYGKSPCYQWVIHEISMENHQRVQPNFFLRFSCFSSRLAQLLEDFKREQQQSFSQAAAPRFHSVGFADFLNHWNIFLVGIY